MSRMKDWSNTWMNEQMQLSCARVAVRERDSFIKIFAGTSERKLILCGISIKTSLQLIDTNTQFTHVCQAAKTIEFRNRHKTDFRPHFLSFLLSIVTVHSFNDQSFIKKLLSIHIWALIRLRFNLQINVLTNLFPQLEPQLLIQQFKTTRISLLHSRFPFK